MKYLILLAFLLLSSFTHAQSRETKRELGKIKSLMDVGGAGNGGGEVAIRISRLINRRSLELKYSNVSKKYKLVVGSYNLCDDETPDCQVSMEFYPEYGIVLVNLNNLNKLSVVERDAFIDEIVGKINAK